MEEKVLEVLDKLYREFQDLKGDVQDLKGDVQGLKGDVQDLKGDVQGLKGDVQGLKGDVQNLKSDVQDLKSGQAKLEISQTELKSKLELMAEVQQAHMEATERRFDEVIHTLREEANIQKDAVRTFAKSINERVDEIYERQDALAEIQGIQRVDISYLKKQLV